MDALSGRVTLLHSNGTYWFFGDEVYIDDVLSGGRYPRPVRCIMFRTAYEMHDFLRGEVALDTLWTIHPAIVDRLRADGELEEATANAR